MSRTLFEQSILYPYFQKLTTPFVKDAVVRAVDVCPDYFWTLPASTSGKYHGVGELLIGHVASCCETMSVATWRQMESVWNVRAKDMALGAMLLHDNWRCGYPGRENHDSKTGKLHTSNDHPKVGGELLKGIWKDFSADAAEQESLELMAEAVWFHYGPWGERPQDFLKLAVSDIRCAVHTVDYYDTTYARRRKG